MSEANVEHLCGQGCATRRIVLAGAGATGLTALLAGCQTYGEAAQPAPAQPAPAQPAPVGGGAPTGVGRPVLARTADIPVGGGRVFADKGVVVTQPREGTVKAFSAVCTHQGCTVASVEGGTINCPCHGSKFDVADGSVKGGPAPRPLPPAAITVDGGEIRLG
jgi:Rieske Fe-S protein